jgi:hypothetical protein
MPQQVWQCLAMHTPPQATGTEGAPRGAERGTWGELGGSWGGVVYVHSSCSNGNSLAEPYNDVYRIIP